jgi:hypothetical protein
MPTLYPSSSDHERMLGRNPVRSRVIRLSQQLSQGGDTRGRVAYI